MQVLRSTVMPLASRSVDGFSSNAYHWVDGSHLNLHLYHVLLETCFDHEEGSIINEKLESNLFVQTALIDMYASQLVAGLAYKLFEDLPKINVVVDDICMNSSYLPDHFYGNGNARGNGSYCRIGEGQGAGYNINALGITVNVLWVIYLCKNLREGNPIVRSFEDRPFESTWRVINKAGINCSYNSDVEKDLEPSNAINFFSDNEVMDLIFSISKLNIDNGDFGELPPLTSQKNLPASSETYKNSKEVATATCNDFVSWRSSLSKVDAWYGSYDSNMWKPIFLCYIEDGKVEGIKKTCRGAVDKNPAKDITWKPVFI